MAWYTQKRVYLLRYVEGLLRSVLFRTAFLLSCNTSWLWWVLSWLGWVSLECLTLIVTFPLTTAMPPGAVQAKDVAHQEFGYHGRGGQAQTCVAEKLLKIVAG